MSITLLLNILIAACIYLNVGGRRRSTRDFFSDINTAILQMETMAEGAVESWALTLATAVEDPALCLDMDIVFIGHTDGYVLLVMSCCVYWEQHCYLYISTVLSTCWGVVLLMRLLFYQ